MKEIQKEEKENQEYYCSCEKNIQRMQSHELCLLVFSLQKRKDFALSVWMNVPKGRMHIDVVNRMIGQDFKVVVLN